MELEWWQSFFSGLWLEVQQAYKTHAETKKEADYIERLIGRKGGSELLNVPCGDGRLSVELALRGYEVTGADITPELLRLAECKASTYHCTIALERHDMRQLPWQNKFDGAFCVWSSFGYFDDEGNIAFLRAVNDALRLGTVFVLETAIAESYLPNFQPCSWKRVGDILIVRQQRYDHLAGRAETEWTLAKNGATEMKHSSVRLYTCRELCSMLFSVGFQQCTVYGSVELDPFALGSQCAIFAAVKERGGG